MVDTPPGNGTAGRLYFPNGYSVGLNYADAYNLEEQQYQTDKWDSACYSVSDEGVILIADHAYQGFSIIRKCDIGDLCKINELTYMCVSKYTDASWSDGYCILPDGKAILHCRCKRVTPMGLILFCIGQW